MVMSSASSHWANARCQQVDQRYRLKWESSCVSCPISNGTSGQSRLQGSKVAGAEAAAVEGLRQHSVGPGYPYLESSVRPGAAGPEWEAATHLCDFFQVVSRGPEPQS